MIRLLSKISRNQLIKAIRFLTWLGALALVWVIFEYMFIGSSRHIPVVKYVKIHIDEFKQHDVTVIQKQQIPFVLIHQTDDQIKQLMAKYPSSISRSVEPGYFIALAIGQELGCVVLKHKEGVLKESCSDATYDYFGRSLTSSALSDALKVPEMSYNKETRFFNLTLQ